MIICPVCKELLIKSEKHYECMNRHHFDVAKQGYTNLYLKSSKVSGDNKMMVEARTRFLQLGHYEPLCQAIEKVLRSMAISSLIDAGCGEGYYTNKLKSIVDEIYAFDLSKEALKHAARENKDVHYFLASIFDIPYRSQSADAIINIFAPCAANEFHRILKEGGYVIKVDPNIDHLWELKEKLYDEVRENDVMDLQMDGFTLESFHEVSFEMELDQEGIVSLFLMTPYAFKTSKEKSEQLLSEKQLNCRASFVIYVYKKTGCNK